MGRRAAGGGCPLPGLAPSPSAGPSQGLGQSVACTVRPRGMRADQSSGHVCFSQGGVGGFRPVRWVDSGAAVLSQIELAQFAVECALCALAACGGAAAVCASTALQAGGHQGVARLESGQTEGHERLLEGKCRWFGHAAAKPGAADKASDVDALSLPMTCPAGQSRQFSAGQAVEVGKGCISTTAGVSTQKGDNRDISWRW